MASNVDQLASSIVRLKVGERTFDTRRSTLLNSGSPILARLIGGDDEGLRGADNDGDRIFVDGDGDGFAILLRALRSTRIDAVPERDRPQLALEADFYEVPWIRAALDPTNRYSPLAPTNRHAHHLALFKRAGLKVQRFQLQAGFPSELHAVRMYLLVPA